MCRHWIIIISVVLMLSDFAVSSFCGGDICGLVGEQFSVCLVYDCGSAWLPGSTVLQLSFEPVVIHLSAWI